jgi:hypothetical protein
MKQALEGRCRCVVMEGVTLVRESVMWVRESVMVLVVVESVALVTMERLRLVGTQGPAAAPSTTPTTCKRDAGGLVEGCGVDVQHVLLMGVEGGV